MRHPCKGLLFLALLAPLLLTRTGCSGPQDINQALLEAAKKGDTATVKALLAEGASVDARDREGCTALMKAVFSGNNDTVRALLEAGADVNAKHKWGGTALVSAQVMGQTALVEILQKAGAQE